MKLENLVTKETKFNYQFVLRLKIQFAFLLQESDGTIVFEAPTHTFQNAIA